MAKKSFADTANPALSFITGAEDTDNTDNTHIPDNTHKTDTTDTAHKTDSTHNTHNADTTQETKSKRLNLLIYPSLLVKLKKIAAMQRQSVNDLINNVLNDYTERNRPKIKRYDSIFGGNEPSDTEKGSEDNE